ncbi:hypothetical protein TeGR_g14630 [Tetraparma gracilis]|uniref:Uncharacterized protein n=1 Tax=Tetraparma gracilis TaxID=2962635 RepID=A0ABQ6M5D1_9STRA|nr:hypothetical protein TeGR_g14630 [Tetraparma gracilis]
MASRPHLCLSFLSGFLLYRLTSAPGTGQPNRLDVLLRSTLGYQGGVSLKFSLGRWRVHLHHWLYLSVIAGFSSGSPLVQSFCLGGSLQGVVDYTDWWNVVSYNYPKNRKL